MLSKKNQKKYLSLLQFYCDFNVDFNVKLTEFDTLLKYLLLFSRREQLDSAPGTPDDDAVSNGSLGSRKSGGSVSKAKRKSRLTPSSSKLNFGEATDDVHVCIMCLRAIMNHQVDFFDC